MSSNLSNEIVFHSLQNSYISFPANGGASAKIVQKLAMHSDPRLTFNTYARVFEDKEQEAVDLLPVVGNSYFAISLAKSCTKQRASVNMHGHKKSQNTLKNAILAHNKIAPRGFEPLLPG